jgi:cbb3-type cytochrome oxidase subunit 3
MNPMTQTVAEQAAGGSLAGLSTLVFILLFAGWTWWAINPANKRQHEASGMIPLLDDEAGGNP